MGPEVTLHRRIVAAPAAFALALGLCAFAGGAGAATPGNPEPVPAGRCIGADESDALAPAATPRLDLLDLVRGAIRRSNAVGAARLLTDAAAADVAETRATALPQLALTGQAGGVDAGSPGVPSAQGGQFQASLTLAAPLYDGGRIRDLASWRGQLAEAARLGELGAREQVALQTVSLALERSRYTVEARVYAQYARKMDCLVGALEDIVSADRGRLSELVQALKTRQQAELARQQTLSQQRLAEVRLRRFVGDALPPAEGVASAMLETPPLPDLLAVAARSNEIAQLDAQAGALDSYVRAVLDGDKPQLGWLVAATRSAGAGNSHSVSGGITFSVPLFNAVNAYSTDAARKRALAARLQRDDALEARKSRMAEVHEQAETAQDRVRRVADIVRDSDLVRNATLQQWQQLGRRSLFDVMAAEGDHYAMRVQYVDALYDTQQSNALLWSLGLGLAVHLE